MPAAVGTFARRPEVSPFDPRYSPPVDPSGAQSDLQADPITRLLTGGLPGALILGVLFAAIASIFLLRLYHRAVVRSMRTRARGPSGSAGTGILPVAPTAAGFRDPEPQVRAAAQPWSAQSLYREAIRAPWRNGAVYAIAGWMFAMVMAGCTLLAGWISVSPLRFLALTVVFAWPVAITLNQVAALRARARLAVIAAYAALFGLVGAIAISLSTALDWPQLLTLWVVSNGPATVLVLGFLNRRIRAVGPIVLIFTLLAVSGAIAALSVVAGNQRLLGLLTWLERYLELGAERTLGLLLLSGTVFVGAPLGWLTMRLVGSSYERKAVSDQSLTVDATWLLFGVVQSIGLVFEGLWWILTGVAAFIVFKVAGFIIRTHVIRSGCQARAAPRLLLLRVFALGRRSERLFDELTLRWRHVGSMQLIAGPDLATTTVEPHEFLDFLSGRLDRRFIDGSEALALRLAEIDLQPDRDGRYRVHDFYCYSDTWTLVLRRLVRDSDVILMDLRGFTMQNAGCLFEVNELVNVAPLGRVRILVDDSTDEAFLRASVENSWANLRDDSPNRLTSPSKLPLLRLTGRSTPDLWPVIRQLCEAVTGAPVFPALTPSADPTPSTRR